MEITIIQAEQIQSQQLYEWKQILQEEVYIALTIYARRDNYKAENEYGIKRGTILGSFVESYLRIKKRGELEQWLGLRGYEELKSFGFSGV